MSLTKQSSPTVLALVRDQPNDFHHEGLAQLKEAGCRTVVISHAEQDTPERELASASGIVWEPWHPQDLAVEKLVAAPRLKVVAGTFDMRFDPTTLSERGIAFIDTSRSMTPSVAEFAVALTLNVLRDIPRAVDDFRRGGWANVNWPDRKGFVYGDLAARRIGLAGFGSINQRFAALVRGFDCDLATFDPNATTAMLASTGVCAMASLVELARHSEIFVVGIPPLPSTQGVINREVIDALPPGALLVLVSRMAVVEQEAMWERVRAGELSVALDVYDPEPPSAETWFLHHPNVLATPHMAGGATFCHRRCFTTACADVVAVLNGDAPRFQVNDRDIAFYQKREPSFTGE